MVDENELGPETEVVNCTVFRGPDGAVYCMSDETLAKHRVPDEITDAMLEAMQSNAEVSGFSFREATPGPNATFAILGTGPVVRRVSLLPPTDTWFDEPLR